MKSSRTIFIIIFLLPVCALSTMQRPEKLIYDGITNSMSTQPLESYFSDDNPRPINTLKMTSTACYRGYVGTWEIKDKKLYLNLLQREGGKRVGDRWISEWKTIDADRIFKTKFFKRPRYPLHASWYSGVLVLDQGGKISGFSLYGFTETTTLIVVNKGRVSRVTTINNLKEGAYTSLRDKMRVVLATSKASMSSDWIDARAIFQAGSPVNTNGENVIRTRGILYLRTDIPTNFLTIPPTPSTPYTSIPINTTNLHVIPENDSFVEIEAVLDEKNEGGLIVKSIRQLEQGESIHRPEYIGLHESSNSTQPEA